ncbi:MAG: GDSL-type esterase/lipase family protein [Candidatus Accumulibacter sp.]|jgi:lysophospholipase L1-like esterase|nr:GDSL-type esterase/lipase family protein [Accumulibacter sp.]
MKSRAAPSRTRIAACALMGLFFAACDSVIQARSVDHGSPPLPTRQGAAQRAPPLSAAGAPSAALPLHAFSPTWSGAADTDRDAVRDENLSGLHNFGDPNFDRLTGKIRVLQSGQAPAETVLRITQFGDSHTASDTITSGLRQLLQARFGDAGIGWIAPMKVPNQSHRLVKYESRGWKLSSSRQARDPSRQKIFPMGGYIATPVKPGARITVLPRHGSGDTWQARFAIKHWKASLTLKDAARRRIALKPSGPSGIWREVSVKTPLRLPFTISAAVPDAAELGGIWLEKNRSTGVVVSAIGANGTTLKNWEYWSEPHQWTDQLTASRSDMVIIAYGTNEAIRPDLDLADMKNVLRESLRTVRKALPDSVIVIVGAPDSLRVKERSFRCEERLFPMLREVKGAQLEVAREGKTLFWDWQAAMGGPCAIEAWLDEGLAKDDLTHLTMEGYHRSAEIFYRDLMALIGEEAR